MKITNVIPSLMFLAAAACDQPSPDLNPVDRNHTPALQIIDPNTGDSIQSSGLFGVDLDSDYLSSYQYGCWNPIELQFQVQDIDGDLVSPLVYMPSYQWHLNYQPLDIQSSDQYVYPEFDAGYDADELLQISEDYFYFENANEGRFEFELDPWNASRSWYMDLFFSATDEEVQILNPLQVRFHMMCG